MALISNAITRQALDSVQLETNFRELQARVHPDRHVRASDADQRADLRPCVARNEGQVYGA